MDNEELEDLLRDLVQAAVSIADNVESIARHLAPEDCDYPDIWAPDGGDQ